ncbi:hypothetical protein AB0D14_42725 [Streptomyces sp. NPDC048484]|uniref:hypothetical protein n=1 Tax=Streptomyces sp. NPDC048484 TaxID=3155146 RepID=UPI00341746FF
MGFVADRPGGLGDVVGSEGSSYHAGRWGLEGFTESVSREASDFNIHLTLVEPGATRTGFASARQYTIETTVYRDNAVGQTRRYLETADENVFTGDPAKLAAAIHECLTALETQKDLAESVAFAH